ncbi:DUF4239 domain-containing protein [Kibdelosporangium phytohabitans]|uniref:DUF4239 domain-containing protein n=1 Tax=Kibdelosporangium phytohabitans TaxID=860235 RepID=A0A0N9IAQ1_9PSEU|nr:DUF4239 domain-containing protein [Kibdelosporangium phytohabitans]ALG11568.1 hypothetical protein AOZ06_36065 [Kibdelosporangium phytohabitans]MBE1462935.1 hypothetical protein [Kibdelosporangium phytohabitans]
MVFVPGYAYLFVVAVMVISAGVMIAVGRRRRAREGTYNSEAIGFVGGVLNALFIVVLAFYTVITWTEADATEQHAEVEASSLIEVYWQVANAPTAERDQIRALLKEYTTEVIEKEWPMLDRKESDPKADDLLVAVRSEIGRLPAEADRELSIRDQALQNIRTASDERRARIEQATGDSSLLTLLLWGTIIGGFAMVAFPLAMGFSNEFRHILSIVVLAGTLAFTVYFAIELDQPFQGLIKVDPDSFTTALTEFNRIP